MNPCNKSTLTVGKILAGTTDNVIPNECEFAGTFCCVEESDCNVIFEGNEEIG